MELKTIKKEIDGMIFYITQMPARRCIKLEKRTLTYLAPMLNILSSDFIGNYTEKVKNNLKNENEDLLDKEIDFSKIVSSIQEVLLNISETEFEQYIFDMFETVAFEGKTETGKTTQTVGIKDPVMFDAIFIGHNITIYKLLLEVMKVNKFAFFELMAGGGLPIDSFMPISQKTKMSEN